MLIVKVRNNYTLQVGKDTANWIRGPKRIKIRDKRVLAGQMHKVEIVQDDGTPDPVIVRGNAPAGQESADMGGARAGFGAQAAVEELLKEPESDEVARENERQRREINAREIMAQSNDSAQERARKRVLEAARLQKASRAKHSSAGIIEEVSDDYVLETAEHVTSEPAAVTIDDLTTRARPITNRVEDSVIAVEDEPTPEELAAAPVIGAQAEARVAEAAKPKEDGIVVKGVAPEKLKRALELIGSGVLENIGEAGRVYEAIQKGLLVVKKPPEYRAELEAYAEKKTGELIEAADALLSKNQELEAQVDALHNDVKPLELQTKVLELETEAEGLRGALTTSEQKLDTAMKRVAELTRESKALRAEAKTPPKKKAAKKKTTKGDRKMQEAAKNRMLEGANKTRDEKDVPAETRPDHTDLSTAPAPEPEPVAAKE